MKAEEVIKALEALNLDTDKLFERIREDLDRGLIKEAKSHLNFVDVLLEK